MSINRIAGAMVVAVVGAESTGKTTLAHQLALALQSRSETWQPPASPRTQDRWRVAWVPEYLRQWCVDQGRTPQRHEQAAIAAEQHRRIEAAMTQHDLVVCDTTGLMTAVYSELVFGDTELHAGMAAWHQQQVDLTLLTALDLPWVPDGHQRDGPQVQGPVDARLRALLMQHRLPFSVVSGRHESRLQHALAAVTVLLRTRGLARGETTPASEPAPSPRRPGLLTRLNAQASADEHMPGPAWSCECCGDAPYERALRRLRI